MHANHILYATKTYHDDTFRSIKNVNGRLGIPRANSYSSVRSESKVNIFVPKHVFEDRLLISNFVGDISLPSKCD